MKLQINEKYILLLDINEGITYEEIAGENVG